jgi:hypothetical protein
MHTHHRSWICCRTPTVHTKSTVEPLRVVLIKYESVLPARSETCWSNFNVWYILEFYITKILISMTYRLERISQLIKVTDSNDAWWKLEKLEILVCMFTTAQVNQCPTMDCVHFQTAVVYTIFNTYPPTPTWKQQVMTMAKKLIGQEKALYLSRNWKLFIELKQLASGLSHIFPCCCLCGYNSHEECICMGIVSCQARGFPHPTSSIL